MFFDLAPNYLLEKITRVGAFVAHYLLDELRCFRIYVFRILHNYILPALCVTILRSAIFILIHELLVIQAFYPVIDIELYGVILYIIGSSSLDDSVYDYTGFPP